MQSLLYPLSEHLFVIGRRPGDVYLRDTLHQVLSAQRSGCLAPGKSKMVNQVPGGPRRGKRGASLRY